jgi:hypothetical protein
LWPNMKIELPCSSEDRNKLGCGEISNLELL